MMHAFTAGAWNPALMKAGFAALLTDGTDPDGLTAEGALDCEKLADSTRAEMVALQGVGLLLKLSGDGCTAAVHMTDGEVYDRVDGLPDAHIPAMSEGGMEFRDYFGDGAFLHMIPISEDAGDPYVQECLGRVQKMAAVKAGLIEDPEESEEKT